METRTSEDCTVSCNSDPTSKPAQPDGLPNERSGGDREPSALDHSSWDDGAPAPQTDGASLPPRKRSYVDSPSLGLAPGCRPVRRIAKKSGRISRPGLFASRKTYGDREIRTESILEMEGLAHIEVNHRYERVAPQPHHLIFHHEKPDGSTRVHSYVPDCAVLTNEGRVIIVDFKWTYLRALPEWAVLEPVIREAYRLDHGATYQVLTEEYVLAEPRRTNVAVMLMHRPIEGAVSEIVAVRGAIGRLGLPSTIGAIREAARLPATGAIDPAFSALMELAMAGEVRIDLGRPFDDASTVFSGARP